MGEALEASATRGYDDTVAMILTYHKIGTQFELGITTVRRYAFKGHLDLLRELDMVFAVATRAAGSGERRGEVAITFDDGYESVYREAAPEMEARGIPGTVFPVVGSIGGCNTWDVSLSPRPFRHLSWNQIRELVKYGFEIGSHTLTHRDLTRLDRPDLRCELERSKKTLEDHLGTAVTGIAYPFGRFSEAVMDEARGVGYLCGFTSVPRTDGDRMAVGRMGVYSIDGPASIRRKLGLVPGYRLEYLKSRIIAGLSLGTTLVRR